jgi:hypothetical protein
MVSDTGQSFVGTQTEYSSKTCLNRKLYNVGNPGYRLTCHTRNGFPVYNRAWLRSFLAAILLVGRDLDWWQETLQQYAGMPVLMPRNLGLDVLKLLLSCLISPDTLWGHCLALHDHSVVAHVCAVFLEKCNRQRLITLYYRIYQILYLLHLSSYCGSS